MSPIRSAAMGLLISLGMLLGCVESAPEYASSGNDETVDAGNDVSSDTDAGTLVRPSLELEEFVAERGSFGNVGLWWFYGEGPGTSFENQGERPELAFELSMARYDEDSGAIDLEGGIEAVAQNPTPVLQAIEDNSEFTIEAWLSFDSNGSSNVLTAPIDGESFVFNLWNDGGNARMEFVDGQVVVADGAFQNGRLVHIVITYRNNLLSIYADGILQGANNVSLPDRWDEATALNIGGPLFGRAAYDGEFFMLGIWSRALSEGEVFQHFLYGRTPDEERDVEQLEPGVGVLVHGRVPAAPQQIADGLDISIESDVMTAPGDGSLRLSSSKRMLLRFPEIASSELDERIVAANFLGIAMQQRVMSEIPFAVAAVWHPWNELEADWLVWRDGDEWGEPGAAGEADRSESFSQFYPFEARRYMVQLPDELIDYWSAVPGENGGIVFYYPEDRNAGEREFFSMDANQSARRPYLARLIRGGTPPGEVLSAPTTIRRDNPSNDRDTSLRWAPVPGAEFYDVFADGGFVGRSLEPAFVHNDGSRNMPEVEYRVLARDSFGRVSDWSESYVINEGL